MKKWVCPNCEAINSGITLCDVCDFENPEFPLVKINDFSINKEMFFEDEEIELKWDIQNFKKLELNINDKIVDVTKNTLYKYRPTLKTDKRQIVNIKLIVYDILGNKIVHSKEAEKKIIVLVKPKIKSFSISKSKVLIGKKVYINWDIKDYEKLILVKNESEEIDVSEIVEMSFIAEETSSFYIKVYCIDSEVKLETEKLSVEVFNPITLKFNSDKTYTIQSKPIHLNWQTENAKFIEIESLFENHKDLPLNGSINCYPSKECEYKITASNDVETIHEIIRINVFPIPSVEHIIIPPLPQLMGNISFSNIELSENAIKINHKEDLDKFYSNKVEKHFKMNKLINHYTNGYEILQKINKMIYG